jgi:hypothetical protein
MQNSLVASVEDEAAAELRIPLTKPCVSVLFLASNFQEPRNTMPVHLQKVGSWREIEAAVNRCDTVNSQHERQGGWGSWQRWFWEDSASQARDYALAGLGRAAAVWALLGGLEPTNELRFMSQATWQGWRSYLVFPDS